MDASSSGAKAVEDILKEFRLGIFLPKLLDLGVECIKDLADLKPDDLKELGFSKIQRNRFRDMASKYGFDLLEDMDTSEPSQQDPATPQPSTSPPSVSSPSQPSVSSTSPPDVSSVSQPSVSSTSEQSVASTSRYLEKSIFNVGCSDYTLFYQTQHNVLIGSTEKLANLDPFKITLKDLMEIIVKRENFSTTDHSAELYTHDGTPLTNDSYLAGYCSLSTRCIESKSTIFAVICKKDRQSTVAEDDSIDDSKDNSNDDSDSDSNDDESTVPSSGSPKKKSKKNDPTVPLSESPKKKTKRKQPTVPSSKSPKKKTDRKQPTTAPSSESPKKETKKKTPKRNQVLNCCLMTGDHHKIPVDLEEDTPKDLKTMLSKVTGIPESVQILKVQKVESFQLDMRATLAKNDLQTDDWLNVYLVQPQEFHGWSDNFTCEIQPYVSQTDKGMGMFAATLYVVANKILKKADIGVKLIGTIRRLTGLSPLVTGLYLLSKRHTLSYSHKVAIVEGLYLLFRRLLPKEHEQETPDVNKTTPTKAKPGKSSPAKEKPIKPTPTKTSPTRPFTRSQRKRQHEEQSDTQEQQVAPKKSSQQASTSDQGPIGSDTDVPDNRVFEHSNLCWMYLLKLVQSTDGEYEKYTGLQMKCAGSNQTLMEPVTVSSIPGKSFNRSHVLKCIEEKIELDGKLVADASSMSQDFEMQKTLLSFSSMSGLAILGYISKSCLVWECPAEAMSKRPEDVEAIKNVKNFKKEWKDERFATTLELRPTLVLSSGDLTINENYQYVVCLGYAKGVGTPLQLHNPATGHTEQIDKHVLAEKLKDYNFKVDAKGAPFEPQEAIIVLLDKSGSMESSCFGSEMTRLVAAKELFYAFVERSMAYNLQHAIGLTTFNDEVKVVGACNEYYESFKKSLETVTSDGGTALYDAICDAADQLKKIKKSHPKCKRRIICLTDGMDQHSTEDPVEAVRKLKSIDCVLDAVQITDDSFFDQIFGDMNILKSIALATGGCCFKPASLPEGRKVFEMETVLSIRTRKMEPKPKPGKRVKVEPMGFHGFYCDCGLATPEELELQRLSEQPWSAEPPCNKPAALSKPVARTHSVLVKASTETKKHKTKDRSKRLLREMAALQREPHPAFSIYPSESHFDFWKILMVGPTDTPYEGGVFSLYAEFPKNYPDAPPTVRFLTPIYHCNINSIGRICHGIFDRNYTSDTNVKTILSCVFGLLMTPEPKDPLDGVLAEEYFTNRDLYNQKGKEWTKIHASKPLKDCEQEMLDSSTLPKRKPPQHLVCPLTKQLFVDPVQTPYGHVYERHAIETAINKVPCDPEAEEPLTKAELTPAIAVRRQATDFRESQAKVAACWLN